jgi:hypothetical protein
VAASWESMLNPEVAMDWNGEFSPSIDGSPAEGTIMIRWDRQV